MLDSVVDLKTLQETRTDITRDNVGEIAKSVPFHVGMVLRAMTALDYGSLTVCFPDDRVFSFNAHEAGPDAVLHMYNWKLPRRALAAGSIGVAESYMDGDWDSPDVTAFLELFCVNQHLGDQLTTPGWINNTVAKVVHWFNQNSHSGSKRNIAAHYDLGNRFYREWLDPSMTYSSAIYGNGANSLEAAQGQKYAHLLDNMQVKNGDHILEIGCGWGGFAEHAAKTRDCKVTGLTISQEQFDYASKRIQNAGLNDKVEIKFQDYRDETGTYDRIASIEMFEAVGEKYWPVYFNKIRESLKTGGMAGLQIITIADRYFESYRKRPDFIQRYIFPGGMLPSTTALEPITIAAGLKLEHDFPFAQDYARTLEEWRIKFWEKWEKLKPMGFDDRFKRMWEFYFHYCEAGFRAESINVRQVFYRKADV